MKKQIIILSLLISTPMFAQTISEHLEANPTYVDKANYTTILWGNVNLETIKSSEVTKDWFDLYYAQYELTDQQKSRLKTLVSKVKSVYVFMGTWCSDTQIQLPQFVHILQDSGLQDQQMRFLALDHEKLDRMKNTPQSITRVPTMVFIGQDDNELGRIVENPSDKGLAHDIISILD